MLFNPEQIHDDRAHDSTGLDYVMLYIEPMLFLEILGKRDNKLIKKAKEMIYSKLEDVLSLFYILQGKSCKAVTRKKQRYLLGYSRMWFC